MKYSMDTSALLDAWSRWYPLDLFPTLWTLLEVRIANGDLIASEEVFHELKRKDDELHAWTKERQGMFVPTTEEVQVSVKEILAEFKTMVDSRRGKSRLWSLWRDATIYRSLQVKAGQEKNIVHTFPTCAIISEYVALGSSKHSAR